MILASRLKNTVLSILLLGSIGCAHAQTVAEQIVQKVPSSGEVYRHGYEELSATNKALYDTIVGSLLRFEANNFSAYYYHRCDLLGVPSTRNIYDLIDDLSRIQHDMPEMYILSSSIPRSDYSTGNYYARIGYVNTPQRYLNELEHLEAIADSILEPIQAGMSTYEKLLILHDGFINWGDYGDMVGADAGNIRGALINKRAVCEGFARAGLFLCQRAGLRCIYVEGQLLTSSTNETWGNHAWNFVEVDGEWYLMDLTTDGGFPNICGHSAFLRGQDYFNENYRLYTTDGSDSNLDGVYQALPTLANSTYTASAPTNCDGLPTNNTSKKVLQNGHLYILKNAAVYTILGTPTK